MSQPLFRRKNGRRLTSVFHNFLVLQLLEQRFPIQTVGSIEPPQIAQLIRVAGQVIDLLGAGEHHLIALLLQHLACFLAQRAKGEGKGCGLDPSSLLDFGSVLLKIRRQRRSVLGQALPVLLLSATALFKVVNIVGMVGDLHPSALGELSDVLPAHAGVIDVPVAGLGVFIGKGAHHRHHCF